MLGDDDVEGELGLELDLVERLEVGRVRDRDRQPVAALAQRQHAQRGDELLVDDVLGKLVDVERGEVDQRMAERVGREARDLPMAAGDRIAEFGQLVDEARVALRGLARDRFGAIRAQLAMLDQRARQAGEGTGGARSALSDSRHRRIGEERSHSWFSTEGTRLNKSL